MKTMKDYTQYCTEEQTRRAHKLGAPLDVEKYRIDDGCVLINDCIFVHQVTTQQMIGWLEEQQDIREIEIYRDADGDYSYDVLTEELNQIADGGYYDSKKQAELAAIDAALDYLEKGGAK